MQQSRFVLAEVDTGMCQRGCLQMDISINPNSRHRRKEIMKLDIRNGAATEIIVTVSSGWS